jgi:hypothetical protein
MLEQVEQLPAFDIKDIDSSKIHGPTVFDKCLHEACTGGHLRIVKYLIEIAGADVKARDKFGRTPLHCAASNEKLEVLKYLIERGADVDAQNPDNYFERYTALGEAAIRGKFGVAKMLLENGADVGREGFGERSPLYAASVAIYPKLVELLLRFGADPEGISHNGETPLIGLEAVPKSIGNRKPGAKKEVRKLLNDAIVAKHSCALKWLITGMVVALLTVMGLKVYYNHQRAARHKYLRQRIIQEQRRAKEV